MKLPIIILLTLLLLGICRNSLGQQQMTQAITEFRSSPEFKHASISFLAIDSESNQVIAELNPELSIASASTVKLFSTAAALELIGPNYQPETRIYIDGPIDNGVLKGNVWIRGGGDPSLGSRYFNSIGKQSDFLEKWVESIKSLGIQSITGSIIADGSGFSYDGVPDGWSWNDIGNYYGAGPSGICLFDNMVSYYFKTGSTAGSPTTLQSTFPEIEKLVFRNRIKSEKVNGDNSYLYGGPYSLDRFGKGSLPLNQTSFEVKGSMPDPEYQLAIEFAKKIVASGIKLSGQAKGIRTSFEEYQPRYDSTKQLIHTHLGASIKEIVGWTNLKSVNLFAEQLLFLISYHKTEYGSTEKGIELLTDWLSNRQQLSGLILKDGSGLSRSNGITAKNYVDLLSGIMKSTHYNSYFNSLPVSGKTGTLTSLCTDEPCQGRVIAKSGTMSRIKSYAGYIHSNSGKKIVFALIVQNFDGGSARTVDRMEKLFNSLITF
jgi:D-alanyl-D-alanine carboxypeptidase/D-alanyl-D-alanine-endopeptidase (penicillin-binding protein 4)